MELSLPPKGCGTLYISRAVFLDFGDTSLRPTTEKSGTDRNLSENPTRSHFLKTMESFMGHKTRKINPGEQSQIEME